MQVFVNFKHCDYPFCQRSCICLGYRRWAYTYLILSVNTSVLMTFVFDMYPYPIFFCIVLPITNLFFPYFDSVAVGDIIVFCKPLLGPLVPTLHTQNFSGKRGLCASLSFTSVGSWTKRKGAHMGHDKEPKKFSMKYERHESIKLKHIVYNIVFVDTSSPSM